MKNTINITHPNLLKEWDYSKNTIKPTNVTYGSNKKVWWKCQNNHKWKTSIYHRSIRMQNCPYCSNREVSKTNNLKYQYPDLAKEWSSKNKIKSTEIIAGSNKKVWWKCKKCQYEWKTTANLRVKNKTGCPLCNGKVFSENKTIKFTHKNLLKEWSIKNTIQPNEITYGSKKKIWWQCEVCKQEWVTSVQDRCINKTNCPYCSNRKINYINSLYNKFPELMKEWNWKKNIINPREISSGSIKKAWWKCKNRHEWKAIIDNRTRGSGCPVCNESKGEKEIARILKKLNIRYQCQYKFKKINKYRFDFAIFEKYARKPYAVIEYQGEQHYEPICFGGISFSKAKNNLQKVKENDKIKKQFCLDNNIEYIEIKYTNFKNIRKVLKNNIYEKQFIKKSNRIHNYKYKYNNVNYVNAITKVVITCPKHGDFAQRPSDHLRGNGCPECANNKNIKKQKDFIIEANKIHNNFYNYSKIKYINNYTKINIICPEHGEFLQTPHGHLNGYGCKKCFNAKRSLNNKDFIERSNKIHNHKYDYSKVKYKNNYTKICIVCPKHGEFIQYPYDHMRGYNCPSCKETLGEIKIRQELEQLGIRYKQEYIFACLPSYRFDFALFKKYKRKPYAVIEYHGKQHYMPIRFNGISDKNAKIKFQKNKKNDKIKKQFCLDNNIEYIEISYKYFKDIDKVLKNKL